MKNYLENIGGIFLGKSDVNQMVEVKIYLTLTHAMVVFLIIF